MLTHRLVILTVCALLSTAQPSAADSVADVLTFLITNQSIQTGSVDRDRAAAAATSRTISRALLVNLATLPVPTSSGGFVYRFNADLGTSERTSQTFGPLFVDRAETTGAGQVSVGVTFQHFRFDSLDNQRLRNGTLNTTANRLIDEAQPFDIDRLALAIDASVATIYGNIGLTDDLELGFAAPAVALHVDGSRVNVYRGQTFTQASAQATAIGLADLVVRGKYMVMGQGPSGLAAALDLRLPTGRQADLLGAGSASIAFSAIASLERGRFSLHTNTGVALGGLASEVRYRGALAAAATPRASVMMEVTGRWIDTPGHLATVAAPHPSLPGVETLRLVPEGSSLHTLNLVPGLKWNVADTWVLAASATIPLTSDGLTARLVPFVGLDYVFGR